MPDSEGGRGGGNSADHTLLIFALAVFVFHSPLNQWWAALALPWYMLFVPWLIIILLIAWNQIRRGHGD